ncbi:hypothetical protein GCM10009840_01080 [Pseudolysinimonas kribbensis]|uniref:Uncharacterized protein n=1 Tax=Pseudolysinimonas kribbensis TaxID=433641 RepID=A0ABQ6K8B9_9MICO|nr:hypothetical protein [Pseudolysinimonas kribbensis]GMA95778.1 hypothetical protein GCM10025881_26020 [Pseudolysinimonas kribbensis]
MSARRPIAVLTATAAAVLLLSGCAGIGGQSKLQACADLGKSISSATDGLSSAFEKVQTDPAAAHDAIVKFNDKFRASVDKVSNPDVKKPAQKAADDLDKMATAMQGYKAGSDPAALEKSATTVQDDLNAIGKLCAKP